MISTNVIIIWTGTNASIPAGFTRETTLDGKYPKAWGSQNPNTSGGNASHTHASSAHSHTMNNHSHAVTTDTVGGTASGYTSGVGSGYGIGSGARHYHNATVTGLSGGGLSSVTSTYASVDNDPPYKTVIFIKATSTTSIPVGGCVLTSESSAPSGFYYCDGSNGTSDYRNKYIKGAAGGADAGSTGGSTTNVHTLTHTHTEAAHSHSEARNDIVFTEIVTNTGSGALDSRHTHTFSGADATPGFSGTISLTTTETVEPDYKKLSLIQKHTSAGTLKGAIALWLGSTSSLPSGWVLCDGTKGTVDMKDKFLKLTNAMSESGNTGGSNTHTHAAQAHTHTGSSHTHTFTASGNHSSPARGSAGGGSAQITDTTTHSVTNVAAGTTAWANANTTGDSSDNQPAYLTAAYIQFAGVKGGSFLLNFV